MGKQSKIKSKLKLLFWAVVLTWIFANVANMLLTPLGRMYGPFNYPGTPHYWYDEVKYIAAWNRPLTSREARLLIIGARTEISGGLYKFYHLLHHGTEPNVNRELLNATESDDLLVVAVSEFALFRLRDNPYERLRRTLDIAVTGGLDSENLLYLSAYEGGPAGRENIPYNSLHEVRDAVGIYRSASKLISNFFDPVKDKEYLPIILKYISSDDLKMHWLAKIIGPIKGDPEFHALSQKFRDEYNEYMSENNMSHSFDHFIDKKFHAADYEEKVKQNLYGLKISYILIAIWIIAYIFYLRWRFKQINLSDSQAP